MALAVTTAPSLLWTTVDWAKEHLRVTGTDDDAYIGLLIPAVQRFAEETTWRAILTTTYTYYLDTLPRSGEILLPKPVLQSFTSFKYYDDNNALQTLAASNYDVDSVSEPARIALSYGNVWPTLYEKPNAVELQYVAGWTSAEQIPEGLKQAMYFTLAHFFEHRGPVVIGPNAIKIPYTIDMLYAPYRVFRFM